MTTAAAMVLGLAWASSALLKMRNFDNFGRDVHDVVPARSRTIAALVLIVEFLLTAALVTGVLRDEDAMASVGFLLILTASFIPRARSKLTVTCACFGTRHDTDDSGRISGWQGIRRSLSLIPVFLRNATLVSLAATAAAIPGAIPTLVLATWLLLALAYAASITGLQRQRKTVPHPNQRALLRRRRTLFATYWNNNLWTSWMICFPE